MTSVGVSGRHLNLTPQHHVVRKDLPLSLPDKKAGREDLKSIARP